MSDKNDDSYSYSNMRQHRGEREHLTLNKQAYSPYKPKHNLQPPSGANTSQNNQSDLLMGRRSNRMEMLSGLGKEEDSFYNTDEME